MRWVGWVTYTGLELGPRGIIPFTLADDRQGLWGQSSANGIIYSHNTIEVGQGGAGMSVCLWEEILGGSSLSMWGWGDPGEPKNVPPQSHMYLWVPPSYMLMCLSTLYIRSEEYKPLGTPCWHFYKGGGVQVQRDGRRWFSPQFGLSDKSLAACTCTSGHRCLQSHTICTLSKKCW